MLRMRTSLPDRVGVGAEQLLDHGLAQHDDLGAAVDVGLAEVAPAAIGQLRTTK